MHELVWLRELLVVFSAALLVVVVLHRLRLPAIAGFIVAGAAIGPNGLHWVGARSDVEQLAGLGVVLLLFTIGLEFSLASLRRLARPVAIGGGLQVGLTTGLVVAIARSFGAGTGPAVFLGFVVALSSTAIVLRGLAERGDTDAPHGRLIVGVLLFQDLCVVPMMLVLPALAGQGRGGPAELLRALGTATLVVLGTAVLARTVVPRILDLVAATRQRDLFLLAVLVVCAGVAWLTSLAGLSLALGAFLAGVVLADSEYGHQALADILPLRDLFTSLFFVSVGMLLDLQVVAERPVGFLGLVAALLVGKASVAAFAATALRVPLRVAVLSGLALAQIGEFSLVLAALGERLGLASPVETRLLLAASVTTMLVAPIALRLGPIVAAGTARLGTLERVLGLRGEEDARAAPPAGHVVVLGYGVGGRMLADVLERAGVAYVAADVNVETVREARRRGQPVQFGDVTSPEILRRLHAPSAAAVVVLLNDHDATLRAVRSARRLAPDVAIVARVRYAADAAPLVSAGANEAVAQEVEASLEVIERVLRVVAPRRAPVAHGAAAGPEAAQPTLPPELDVVSLAVAPGAWIAGRSLADSRLRALTGASVVAIRRGDDAAVHPAPDDRIEAGDVLCLVGHPGQIEAARGVAERGPSEPSGGA